MGIDWRTVRGVQDGGVKKREGDQGEEKGDGRWRESRERKKRNRFFWPVQNLEIPPRASREEEFEGGWQE